MPQSRWEWLGELLNHQTPSAYVAFLGGYLLGITSLSEEDRLEVYANLYNVFTNLTVETMLGMTRYMLKSSELRETRIQVFKALHSAIAHEVTLGYDKSLGRKGEALFAQLESAVAEELRSDLHDYDAFLRTRAMLGEDVNDSRVELVNYHIDRILTATPGTTDAIDSYLALLWLWKTSGEERIMLSANLANRIYDIAEGYLLVVPRRILGVAGKIPDDQVHTMSTSVFMRMLLEVLLYGKAPGLSKVAEAFD